MPKMALLTLLSCSTLLATACGGDEEAVDGATATSPSPSETTVYDPGFTVPMTVDLAGGWLVADENPRLFEVILDPTGLYKNVLFAAVTQWYDPRSG